MKRVLVVEDSKMLLKMLCHVVTEHGFVPVAAASLAEAQEQLAASPQVFLAAVLDLNLPDAPNGEVVDLVVPTGTPVIVLTANYDEERREALLKKNIVDYAVKDGVHVYDYIGRVLQRLVRNRHVKALVVDDTATMRAVLSHLLRQHNFEVLEAANGKEALQVIEANPDIRLLLTDYNMPEMDGFELTMLVRQRFDREAMAIIGLSAQGSQSLSARFIKHGANDFLSKPFCSEEFYCRIMQNMEALDHFDAIRDSANRDYLTQLYNRRYFFEVGGRRYKDALTQGKHVCLAMIDIDFFKKVNDTYGHDAGDQVLRRMALTLKEALPGHLVARFGGEEYCVLMLDVEPAEAVVQLQQLRATVERSEVTVGDQVIRYTVSIGVNCAPTEALESSLQLADRRLYLAKKTGRNRVIWQDEPE